LRHVPRARRDDSASKLIRRSRADRREGAAQLEGADRMEALELQQDPRVGPQRDERRAENVVADPLARLADLLERDQVGSLSLASSVKSVRTVQSSGNILNLIRPASSSTGVPCVPTTSSPSTRRTSWYSHGDMSSRCSRNAVT